MGGQGDWCTGRRGLSLGLVFVVGLYAARLRSLGISTRVETYQPLTLANTRPSVSLVTAESVAAAEGQAAREDKQADSPMHMARPPPPQCPTNPQMLSCFDAMDRFPARPLNSSGYFRGLVDTEWGGQFGNQVSGKRTEPYIRPNKLIVYIPNDGCRHFS
jgi:hypothetical protein